MRERFIGLWKRVGARSNLDLEFTRLQIKYSQPWRFYHNLTHIKSCLVDLDSAKHLTRQPDLVELAIWYHDAVYNPKEKDNEEKSAELAYNVCLTAKLPKELARKVRNIILATKHDLPPRGMDARILVDVDLSILGKQVKEFDRYERNIRKEYFWVSENKFRKERSIILQRFLDRESIYSTDFFREKYESKARINLQRSIDSLR